MTSHCLLRCLEEQLGQTKISFSRKHSELLQILWAYMLCLGQILGPRIYIGI